MALSSATSISSRSSLGKHISLTLWQELQIEKQWKRLMLQRFHRLTRKNKEKVGFKLSVNSRIKPP
jgi:hypothetical protein